MTIDQMEVGQKGRVAGFRDGDRAYRQKLIQMGMSSGMEFTVLRKAPLGDPVEIKCGSVLLTLRRGECGVVKVEVI